MKNKKRIPIYAVLCTLAINTVIKTNRHSKKRYQIDSKSKDFVFLHEFERNGQVVSMPANCIVIVQQGF